MSDNTVATHDVTEDFKVRVHIEAHEPRADDPHYHVFNATRDRMKKEGKLVCWRCAKADSPAEHVELHHFHIEYSLANDCDWQKVAAAFPEANITSVDGFLDWVNTEANMLPLCVTCHRGTQGIHEIPYPLWTAQKYAKDGETVADVVKSK